MDTIVIDQHGNLLADTWSFFGMQPCTTWIAQAVSGARVLVVQVDTSAMTQMVPWQLQQVLRDL